MYVRVCSADGCNWSRAQGHRRAAAQTGCLKPVMTAASQLYPSFSFTAIFSPPQRPSSYPLVSALHPPTSFPCLSLSLSWSLPFSTAFAVPLSSALLLLLLLLLLARTSVLSLCVSPLFCVCCCFASPFSKSLFVFFVCPSRSLWLLVGGLLFFPSPLFPFVSNVPHPLFSLQSRFKFKQKFLTKIKALQRTCVEIKNERNNGPRVRVRSVASEEIKRAAAFGL